MAACGLVEHVLGHISVRVSQDELLVRCRGPVEAGLAATTADDIIRHCRANLASYKCPRYVVFRELPMTSTGKVQKFVLRYWAKAVPA